MAKKVNANKPQIGFAPGLVPAKRNPVARLLAEPVFRTRVVPSKTIYARVKGIANMKDVVGK